MVTLNSCLIWQIISFILPSNEYGCVYAWITLVSGPDADFCKKKIIFSDEAHFDLGGYVSKQNWRIWGTENPHAYIEKPTHPKRVTVWCGFWSRGIIGPFFFENEQGGAVTVNGGRYRDMLIPENFVHKNLRGWYWQHLVSTGRCYVPHSRSYTRCFPDVVWPPRNCDLTPLDYYLWGAIKDKCYVDKPETIDALNDNIREAIGEI